MEAAPNEESGTRAKIRTAAKTLFAQRGYQATSIKDIGQAAESNSALISYYFGSKENLFVDIVRSGLPIAKLAGIDISSFPAPAAFYLLVSEFLASQEQEPEVFAIIHNEVSLRSERSVSIQQILLPFFQTLRQVLRTGHSQGLFSFANEDTAFRCTVGVLLYRKHDWLLDLVGEPESADLLAKHVLTYLAGGIGFKGDFAKT